MGAAEAVVVAVAFGAQLFAAVRVFLRGEKNLVFSVSVTWVLRDDGYSNLII